MRSSCKDSPLWLSPLLLWKWAMVSCWVARRKGRFQRLLGQNPSRGSCKKSQKVDRVCSWPFDIFETKLDISRVASWRSDDDDDGGGDGDGDAFAVFAAVCFCFPECCWGGIYLILELSCSPFPSSTWASHENKQNRKRWSGAEL